MPKPTPSELTVDQALALAAVGRDLLGTDNSGEVARRVCEAVRELVGADGATFVLREDDLVYYAEEDAVDALWKGRRFPAAQCISGWAIIHRQTAVIEDVYADERIPQAAYRPTFVRSLAMAPLGRESPVGGLGAYWRSRHRASHLQVWLLEQIATLAERAIDASMRAMHAADDPSHLTADGRPSGRLPTDEPGARLLAVVAHDLRQPLSTITQAADALMEESTDGGLDRRQLARMVERGATRARRLIEQVLEYARLSQGPLPLRLEPAQLDELCRSVSAELDQPNDRVRVEGQAVGGLVDRERLRQVVANLARNAIQHGATDKPVTLRVERHGDLGRIVVHNHGPVIPPELKDSLFDPFTRNATDHGDGSLGLGLYIADQIVRAHGGQIDLGSEEGAGTSFVVELPLSPTMLDLHAKDVNPDVNPGHAPHPQASDITDEF